MKFYNSRQGYTLPLTIVHLVVISTLAISLYEMVKAERMESFRRFQKELSMETALDSRYHNCQQSCFWHPIPTLPWWVKPRFVQGLGYSGVPQPKFNKNYYHCPLKNFSRRQLPNMPRLSR